MTFTAAALLAALETHVPARTTGLVVGLSGGQDSMCLLVAAARLQTLRAAGRGLADLPLRAVHVDHGLQSAAAGFRAACVRACAEHGVALTVLAVTVDTAHGVSVEAAAREARYAGLARELGPDECLLTAHHADDQAETVLMRLGRGSGIGGLAGMRRETLLGAGLTLLRPLLDVPKAALVTLCRAENVAFVEDASNDDPAYARTRLRAQTATLTALGLDRSGLTRLARRMARADAALEAEAMRVEASLAIEHSSEGLRMTLAPLVGAEAEIRLRVLRRAIDSVSASPILRLDRLENLSDGIEMALRKGQTYRGTLAGLRIMVGRDHMIAIVPERERRRGQGLPREKGSSFRD